MASMVAHDDLRCSGRRGQAMANVTLKDDPIHTVGESPRSAAGGPNFRLTRGDLSDISLADFEGKVKVLNILPSLDTSVGDGLGAR